MKITKNQLRRIIREAVADMRDSTTEYYTDSSGKQSMVPDARWAEEQGEKAQELARNVSEYIAFAGSPAQADPKRPEWAIKQVAEDERIDMKIVKAAVDEFGIDIKQFDDDGDLDEPR